MNPADGGRPRATDQEASPRARSGCAPLVAIVLVIVLVIAVIVDLGISSFLCMDTQGDNMACAIGLVSGHLPLYFVAVGMLALITAIVRRVTR